MSPIIGNMGLEPRFLLTSVSHLQGQSLITFYHVCVTAKGRALFPTPHQIQTAPIYSSRVLTQETAKLGIMSSIINTIGK